MRSRTPNSVIEDNCGVVALAPRRERRNICGIAVLGIVMASGWAATGCGSDEMFLLELASNERVLDSEAATSIGSNVFTFDQLVVVGDLDGDGIADAMVRPWMFLPSGDFSASQVATSVSVLYGGRTLGGELTLETLPSLTGVGENSSTGATITPVGDVDGDGLADVLIRYSNIDACLGLPDADRSGGVYLVYGSSTRLQGATRAIDAGAFLRLPVLCDQATPESTLGDLDGDGKSDFAISAMSSPFTGQPIVTREYLFYGRSPRLSGTVDLVATADAEIRLPPAGGTNRSHLLGVGDVDGDGHTDFFARTTLDVSGSSVDLRLVHGQATRLAGTVAVTDLPQSRFVGDTLGGLSLGEPVTALGDLDGDGLGDFALVETPPGYPGVQPTGPFAMRVFYGRRGGFPTEVPVSSADAALAASDTAHNPAFNLGSGDVDGDGIPDLVMSDAARRGHDGALYVLKGSGSRLAGKIDPASAGRTYVGRRQRLAHCVVDSYFDCIAHESVGAFFGIGDLTGDGRADVLASAPWHDELDGVTLGKYGTISRAYVLSLPAARKP